MNKQESIDYCKSEAKNETSEGIETVIKLITEHEDADEIWAETIEEEHVNISKDGFLAICQEELDSRK